MEYDKIIIGAGLYGLYSAVHCGDKKEKILVLECEDAPFKRATYINQARVHMGYHYPRSYSTAIKSAKYFERFNRDYDFCINDEFQKIYAISSDFSWTSSEQFEKFCRNAGIKCEKINSTKYIKDSMCEDAFLTREYTYDAEILKKHLLEKINSMNNVNIIYNVKIDEILKIDDYYVMPLNGINVKSKFLLNSTYASINQILNKLNLEPFKIKYELCEIILCKVNDDLRNVGITVMDGPFFSIMPFGKTGLHSLTSVTFTPHMTSYDALPTFECQNRSEGYCSKYYLGNCNDCIAKPESAWKYMSNLARKYLSPDMQFEYVKSLYSMKPILRHSEIDDSRPTVIKKITDNPTFVTVLSGKINTVYDLDEVLDDVK